MYMHASQKNEKKYVQYLRENNKKSVINAVAP